jgi:hypothetical protein
VNLFVFILRIYHDARLPERKNYGLFYTALYDYQNSGRSCNTNIDNSSLDRVEEFRYLGTNLTNQNSITEEIKSVLKSGNCLLSFGEESFVFQVVMQKIKMHRNIILTVVFWV